jgi:methionyl-tRNA synthetase
LAACADDSITCLPAAAILLQPIVPDSARKILDYLAVPEAKRSLAQASLLADDPAVMGAVLSNAKSFVAFPKIQK